LSRKIEQQDYIYKTTPFTHQREIFEQSRDLENFAYLMEQGTGKSKVVIDNVAYLYIKSRLDLLIVIAPNEVHYNWIANEIPAHMPDYINYKTFVWDSEKKDQKWFKDKYKKFFETDDVLKIFAINIEAIITKKGWAMLEQLANTFRCMIAVDESQTIKTPKAKRTKSALNIRKFASYRRILTGTPITQGPLDAYTQFAFLDPDILGYGSYYAFRNRYAVVVKEINRTTGAKYDLIVGYQNIEELNQLMAPHSARVLKKDCLDLPDKIYQKKYVKLSATQKSLYNQLREDLIVEFEGMELTAQIVLTKMLRLQQITGGFFPSDEEGLAPRLIEENGPRERALMELINPENGFSGKAIIWCKFTAEIVRLRQLIESTYGEGSAVSYYGATSGDDRKQALKDFQDPESKVKFFIGQPKSGGVGLTLHAATTVIYYSNDFSLNMRLQSEDRAHRIGQHHNVTYIDIIARGTLDEKVVEALRDKKNIADLITGDESLHWI
jgi:SNF2 family DNA or RNA helicase